MQSIRAALHHLRVGRSPHLPVAISSRLFVKGLYEDEFDTFNQPSSSSTLKSVRGTIEFQSINQSINQFVHQATYSAMKHSSSEPNDSTAAK